jgi:hypothetical protein
MRTSYAGEGMLVIAEHSIQLAQLTGISSSIYGKESGGLSIKRLASSFFPPRDEGWMDYGLSRRDDDTDISRASHSGRIKSSLLVRACVY